MKSGSGGCSSKGSKGFNGVCLDSLTPTMYDSTFENLMASQDNMRHSLDRFHDALTTALQQMKDQQSFAFAFALEQLAEAGFPPKDSSQFGLPSHLNKELNEVTAASTPSQSLAGAPQTGLPPNSLDELSNVVPASLPSQALAQELNHVGEASLPEDLFHGFDKVSFPEASLPGSEVTEEVDIQQLPASGFINGFKQPDLEDTGKEHRDFDRQKNVQRR